jgi:small nuclear ribonucleoprotein (snRNP)-like protein
VLDELIGERIVVDMRSSFVILGILTRLDEKFLELKNADVHDLRDTETTRELYIAESRFTGIKRNRKRVLLIREEIVAISRLDDVVDD